MARDVVTRVVLLAVLGVFGFVREPLDLVLLLEVKVVEEG
jgi:hypothetical protein